MTRTAVYMDTHVTITVVTRTANDLVEPAIARAFDWFARVEAACSRFEETSEISQLAGAAGEASPVSDLVFEVVQFSIALARSTDGAFDPTIGRTLEQRGFNRNYRTGRRASFATTESAPTSFRDVVLDPARRTITLRQPLLLDLGAAAKGFAIDLAARELAPFHDFGIDAGGDLYLHGQNPEGKSWRVGIRHPRQPTELVETVQVADLAVCTSGDYERAADAAIGGHHILDPRSGRSPERLASVTVLAPTAMAADAFATAAFVLGPRRGVAFLQRQGVEGLFLSAALERHATPGFGRFLAGE